MPRIKGRFCPLTDELGNDERFIINSTDLDKLLYILVMYTCHMTYHQAPTDARFYKIRYGLRAKLGQIRGSLGRLQGLYKGLSWVDGKVSLLNSVTYKSQPVQKVLEVEVEKKKNKKESTDPRSFIEKLKSNPAFTHINIDNELHKMDAWLSLPKNHGRQKTPGFVLNWLKKIEAPLKATPKISPSNGKDKEQLEKWKREAAPMPEECREQMKNFGIGGRV